MRVTVLGCGPAGLAAAHAASGLLADVRIIAPKRKTPQNGPIFLNTPLPGISTDHPQGFIKQFVVGGSIVDYGIKLYGDVNVAITRDGHLREGIHTWDIQEAYDKMWRMYSEYIEDREVRPDEVDGLVADCDLVVSTAPRNLLCEAPAQHDFIYQPVAMVFHASYPDQPENTVIFNAYPDVPWIRSARMFGHATTEFLPDRAPEEEHRIIRKPLRTNCTCHPRVKRVGRFGTWNNMSWIDTAYLDTRTALMEMIHATEYGRIQ